MKQLALIIGASLLLTACASNVPEDIRTPVASAPTLIEARNNPDQFGGSQVRWGGTIASLSNRETETWVEIVSRRLDKQGRPVVSDESLGRFIARITGFVDPAIYTEGRDLTVTGTLQGVEAGKIGEYDYNFPSVVVMTHYLWEKRLPPSSRYPYYDPFWHDPWLHPYYDPFYWPHYRRYPYYW